MGLEGSVTTITDLNSAWPLNSDLRTEGDDHMRHLKVAVKSLLTNIDQLGLSVESQTLTAASTEITTSKVALDGRQLTKFLLQDGTGGRAITWDAAKFKGAVTGIDTTLSTTAIFNFIGRDDGFWWMVGIPTSGVS